METKTKIILSTIGVTALVVTSLALVSSSSSSSSERVGDSYLVRNYYGQKGYLSNLPRGIRNNNVGNIIIANNDWKGKVPLASNTDGKFEQFYTFEHGLRALLVLLKNYIKNGNDSVKEIIEKYAPSSENDTTSYMNVVANKLNVNPTQSITFDKTTALVLVTAINFVENGKDYPISREQFETAYNLI